MPIYTRGGDRGETDLGPGVRTDKDSPSIAALGALDELSAAIGVVRAEELSGSVEILLREVQEALFELGADLSGTAARWAKRTPFPVERVESLERAIDRFDADLPKLKQFVVPGGARAGALLHWVRTISRRAERSLVGVERQMSEVNPAWLAYMNRLSDLFFVLARTANREAGVEERQRCPKELS